MNFHLNVPTVKKDTQTKNPACSMRTRTHESENTYVTFVARNIYSMATSLDINNCMTNPSNQSNVNIVQQVFGPTQRIVLMFLKNIKSKRWHREVE